ncbi:MAG: LysM peptidoglycan-binding domain-containing protein [Hyphomicrobiales bacterium]
MNSGVVGAVALLAVGGALYLGSTFLGDYFSEPDAATQQVAGEETEGQADGDAAPLALVPEAAETAVEETADAASEAVEDAVDAITDTTEDLADGAVDAVTETMEAVTEEMADDMASDDMASEETAADDMASEEMAALSEEAAGEVLQSLGNDLPEEASEPGTTPVLDVVRIEPSGDVLIAGNAPEGERVGLVYNNEVVAEADVTEGGDFVLVPDEALPTGEGTLEVVVIDEDGNRETQSDEQVAVVLPEEGNEAGFLVGVLRPGEPVEIIERQAPEVEVAATAQPSTDVTPEVAETTETAETDTPAEIETAARAEPTAEAETGDTPFVIVDAIELEGQEIWIAGAAAPGTVIRLYQDNELLGETVTGEEGRYLFEGALRDATGEVTVRADALATGSADVVARAEVPFAMPGTEIADADMAETDMADTDMAETVAETVTEAVEEVAQAASETASETADAASEAVAEIADNAVEAASATADATSELASNAVEAATEAASDAASDVVETVSEAASDAVTPEVEVAATVTPTEQPATNEATPATDTVADNTPADTEVSVATTPAASNERVSVLDTGSVIIRRGDNLWRLSRRVFGQGIRYTSIYDANRDQIRDPALIFPGQVFELPTPQEEWGAVPGVEALEPDQIPGPESTQN